MNQEDLVDAIYQALQHRNLRHRDSGAHRLETPLNPLPGKTLLQRSIHRLHHLTDGFADRFSNRRTDYREQRVGEAVDILLDRQPDDLFHRRHHRLRKLFALQCALLHRPRQNLAYLIGEIFGYLDSVAELVEPFLFRANQQTPQFFKIFALVALGVIHGLAGAEPEAPLF